MAYFDAYLIHDILVLTEWIHMIYIPNVNVSLSKKLFLFIVNIKLFKKFFYNTLN